MHPRLNGEMLPTPDDLLEGAGEFREPDEKGNPPGLSLGSPETPVRLKVYIGLSRDRRILQTHRGVPYDRPSFTASQALLVDGPVAPTEDTPCSPRSPRPKPRS